jgi:DNA-binding transcriptional LysR family regulator
MQNQNASRKGGGVFDTAALEVLCEVARHGSFTAAARSIGYTQSAVSRQIAALESKAGSPLFERLPRGVRPTPAGRVLVEHATVVLARLRSAGEELDALRRLQGGWLRIGAFPTADATLVPLAVSGFRARHPGVHLTLAEGVTPLQLARLGQGELDLAVVSDYPPGLPEAGELELVHLLDDPLLLALPSGHRLAGAGSVRLAGLATENWVEGDDTGGAGVLAAACARAGFTPRIELHAGEWTGKLGFVAAGLGVALVPSLAADALRRDLVLRRLGADAPVRRVYAALPPAAVRAPAAAAFLDQLTDAAGRHRAALAATGLA